MALGRRPCPTAALVHHSDRGVQYADHDYVDVLRDHGVQISMSRVGTPSDNAICERFMRTFKDEEVLMREYSDSPVRAVRSPAISTSPTICGDCTPRSATGRRQSSSSSTWILSPPQLN